MLRYNLKSSVLGRDFVAWLGVQANIPTVLNWRIAAPGHEVPWQKLALPVGRPASLGLHQRVEQGDRSLLVEIALPVAPDLVVTIDTFCLAEVPLHVSTEQITLAVANSLAREGKLLEAANGYAAVHARLPLEACADNAIRCIREHIGLSGMSAWPAVPARATV